jgi:hypothetical protein
MKQPIETEPTVEEQAVEEAIAPVKPTQDESANRRKEDNVVENTYDRSLVESLKEADGQGIDINFLAFFTRAGLQVSEEDIRRLSKLSPREVKRKGYYFNLLAYDGLFPQRGELTNEEGSKFLFMTEGEKPAWEAKLAGLKAKREAQRARDQLTVPDTRKADDAPAPQHRDRVRSRNKERKSYLNPAREDTITIAAHAEPALKEALKKKFEQSGFEHFNDFLVASLERIADEPPVELKPAAELAETALTQSRELQKTISRLTQDLSTRPGPGHSR